MPASVQLALMLDEAPPLPPPLIAEGLPEPVLAAAAALLGRLIAAMANAAPGGQVTDGE